MSAVSRTVSVRYKWLATLLVASLVPLAALGLLALRLQRAGLDRAERELEAAVVDDAARTMGATLADAANGTKQVAKTLTDERIAGDDARIALAKQTVAGAGAISELVIYEASGKFFDAIAKEMRPADTARPPLGEAERAAAGRWLFTEGHVRFVAPFEVDGTVRGYVVAELRPGLLSRIVSDLSQDRFGHRDRMAVLSPDAVVLASDAASPYAAGAKVPQVLVRHGLDRNAFSSALIRTDSFRSSTGEPYVGTFRVAPDLGLGIFVERPEQEAFAALQETRRALLFVLGAAALLSALAGYVLGDRATRPILALTHLTEAYAKRDLKRKNPVKTGDELEALGDAMAHMAGNIERGEAEIIRRAGVEEGLSRYLPREVASAIASGEAELTTGGARKNITVLFADVVGFTAFSERESPERVVEFLNEFFTLASEIVFRNGGMVDKFLGDCVMATFGVRDEARAASQALATAEDLHRFVEAARPSWQERFSFDARLGIGVAAGVALVGNLGSELRLEFTAIGDIVNLASRLETLARPGQTLATDAVRNAASSFEFHELGPHPIRGKAEPVTIYEVVS
jgi:class 3 adenylate cyclase